MVCKLFRRLKSNGHDPVLLRVAAATCVIIGPLFVLGVTPWVVSTAAATVLVLALRLRAPFLLRHVSVPWVMALVVTVVFLGVQVALDLGERRLRRKLKQKCGDVERRREEGDVRGRDVRFQLADEGRWQICGNGAVSARTKRVRVTLTSALGWRTF